QLLERLANAGQRARALHWARLGIRYDETRPELQQVLARLNLEDSSSDGAVENLNTSTIPAKKGTSKGAAATSKTARRGEGFVARNPRDRRAPLPEAVWETSSEKPPKFNEAPVVLPAILDRFFGRECE